MGPGRQGPRESHLRQAGLGKVCAAQGALKAIHAPKAPIRRGTAGENAPTGDPMSARDTPSNPSLART